MAGPGEEEEEAPAAEGSERLGAAGAQALVLTLPTAFCSLLASELQVCREQARESGQKASELLEKQARLEERCQSQAQRIGQLEALNREVTEGSREQAARLKAREVRGRAGPSQRVLATDSLCHPPRHVAVGASRDCGGEPRSAPAASAFR